MDPINYLNSSQEDKVEKPQLMEFAHGFDCGRALTNLIGKDISNFTRNEKLFLSC